MACDKQNMLFFSFYFSKKTKYEVLLLLKMCVISFFLLERLEDRQISAHMSPSLLLCVDKPLFGTCHFFFV